MQGGSVTFGMAVLRSSVLGLVMTAVLGVAFYANSQAGDVDPAPGRTATAQQSQQALLASAPQVRAAYDEYGCTAPDQQPGATAEAAGAVSALIRTDNGKLRMVTFRRGWRSLIGEKPGTLIGVCEKPITKARGQRP